MRRICAVCVLVLLSTSAAAWGAIVVPSRPALGTRGLDTSAVSSARAKSHWTAKAFAGKSSGRSFLFGIHAVQPREYNNRAGSVEAFRFLSRTTGTAGRISLYLDSRTRASKLLVAMYSDRRGHPGARLASGSISSPRRGAWNSVVIRPTKVGRGKAYWIAVLGQGGPLYLRAARSDRCMAKPSAKPDASSMPAKWTLGRQRTSCPPSAYVSGNLGGSGGSGSGRTTPIVEGPLAPVPSGSTTTTATPAPTLSLPVLPPLNTGAPVISGLPVEGQTLTTTDGAWTGSPTSFRYEWEDCDSLGIICSAIGGVTAHSYTDDSVERADGRI